MAKVRLLALILGLVFSFAIYSEEKSQADLRNEKKYQIGVMGFNNAFYPSFSYNINSKFTAGIGIGGSNFNYPSNNVVPNSNLNGFFQTIENKDSKSRQAAAFVRWFPFDNIFYVSLSAGVSNNSKNAEEFFYSIDNSNSTSFTYSKYSVNYPNRFNTGMKVGIQYIFSSGIFISAGIGASVYSSVSPKIYISNMYSSNNIDSLTNYYLRENSLRNCESSQNSRNYGPSFDFKVGVAF
jgi:hypothetical protein